MIQDNRLIDNLQYNLGETIMGALNDPTVLEIIVNNDGKIWIERLGSDMEEHGTIDNYQTRLVINLVASALETTVTNDHPYVEGELPIDGSRFEGVIPPIASAPSFSIRKKASMVFSLEDYVKKNIMPAHLVDVFHEAVANKKNILVVGGTGSGKTTFVNALIRAISQFCPKDRLLILEDTMELQSQSVNTQFMRTSDKVTMNDLLKICMRMRPDRILIGEVRDGAALSLLKSWNTGHPGGIATVHANGAEEGLDRLEELIGEATNAPKQKLIGRAVDLIIYIERAAHIGRRILDVIKVDNYDPKAQKYVTHSLYSYKEE